MGDDYRAGVVGWAITLGTAAVVDVVLIRTRRPTMSRTLGHYLPRPLLGPILAGSVCGLGYHLLVEELLPAFRAARNVS